MTADGRNMGPDLRSAAAIRLAACLHTRDLPYDSIAPKTRSVRHQSLFQGPFPRGSPAIPAITLP